MDKKIEKEAKELNNECLYGGDPAVMENAIKTMENTRRHVKKVMKPAEDAANDLIKMTASESSRTRIKGVIKEGIEDPEDEVVSEEENLDGLNIREYQLANLNRYTVEVTFTGSVFVDVVAADEYEAEQLAQDYVELVAPEVEFGSDNILEAKDSFIEIDSVITTDDEGEMTLDELVSLGILSENDLDDYMQDSEFDESVIRVKNRNGLSKLLSEVKGRNLDFTVSRSLKEGYRYDVKVSHNLNEASSAEKKAYKQGGEAHDDLIIGRAIARIKDPEARAAAIAAMKAGRKDVIKSFTGERKDSQVEYELDKKFQKMQAAGTADESLTETKSIQEEAKIVSKLSKFEPWSGAVNTWNKIKDADKVDELDGILEDLYPEGISDNELNDLLWFESEWVLRQLNISEESTPEIDGEEELSDEDIKLGDEFDAS